MSSTVTAPTFFPYTFKISILAGVATITEYDNKLGSVVWTKPSAGVHRATLLAAFQQGGGKGCAFFPIGNNRVVPVYDILTFAQVGFMDVYHYDDDFFEIEFFDMLGVAADLEFDCEIEVRSFGQLIPV